MNSFVTLFISKMVALWSIMQKKQKQNSSSGFSKYQNFDKDVSFVKSDNVYQVNCEILKNNLNNNR